MSLEAPRGEKCEVIRQEVAREVNQLLRVIFSAGARPVIWTEGVEMSVGDACVTARMNLGWADDIEVDVRPPGPRGAPPNSRRSVR